MANFETYAGTPPPPCVCSDTGVEDVVNQLRFALEQEQKKREALESRFDKYLEFIGFSEEHAGIEINKLDSID